MVKQIGDVKLYSIIDLSKSLGLTERTIRGWFYQGRLKGVKLGKEWYISEENLKRFLNAEKGGEKIVKQKTLKERKKKTRKG
ncbi:MAG: helix-turn-helix domain-containing protein [Candidatus Edwardsbacteria bacterium]